MRSEFKLWFEIATVGMIGFAVYYFANRWVGAFLLLTLLLWTFGSDHRFGFQTLFMVILAVMFYLATVLCVKAEHIDKVMNYLCVIALANVAMLVLQEFNIDPLFQTASGGKDEPVGLMSMRNEVSALLAFCFPAFLRRKWVWCVPAVLAGLLMSRSFGGILATVCGLLFLCYALGNTRNTVIALAAGGLLIGAVLVIENYPLDARLKTWKTGLGIWSQEPTGWFVGEGLGRWKTVMSEPENWYEHRVYFKQAHNEFVQGLFEMGAGFLVILAGYLVSVYRRYRFKAILPVMALVIIITNCTVNFPMHVAPTALVAVLWLAMLEVRLRQNV